MHTHTHTGHIPRLPCCLRRTSSRQNHTILPMTEHCCSSPFSSGHIISSTFLLIAPSAIIIPARTGCMLIPASLARLHMCIISRPSPLEPAPRQSRRHHHRSLTPQSITHRNTHTHTTLSPSLPHIHTLPLRSKLQAHHFKPTLACVSKRSANSLKIDQPFFRSERAQNAIRTLVYIYASLALNVTCTTSSSSCCCCGTHNGCIDSAWTVVFACGTCSLCEERVCVCVEKERECVCFG